MPAPETPAEQSECTPPIDLDWLKRTTTAAITRPQAAQVLGVDERTVTRAIDSGQIPSLHIGRRVLIPRLPLLKLLGADTASEVSSA